MDNLKRYKIGLAIITGRDNMKIFSCNCGIVTKSGRFDYYDKCKCGNTHFITLRGDKKRTVVPYIDIIKSNSKGFQANRTNLSLFYDDDFKLKLKENMKQTLVFDMLNNNIEYTKNGTPIAIGFNDEIQHFFRGLDDMDFINDISTTPELKELYSFIYDRISDPRSLNSRYGYYRRYSWNSRRFWRGLQNMIQGDLLYMQILANAGLGDIKRFYNEDLVNKKGTTPRAILGDISKSLFKHILNDRNLTIRNIRDLKKMNEKFDGNTFKEILEIAEDEANIMQLVYSMNVILEIYEKYEYRNIKKLVLYLFREIKITQGIVNPSNGVTLLKDYLKMSKDLEQKVEKYPKSLKKEHDIVLRNYRVKEDEITRNKFTGVVSTEKYSKFEYEDKVYSIIAPKEIDDINKEGDHLSHCIASYISDIVEEKCRIFFLRHSNDIDTPLVSIEVRNDRVRQVKGYDNRRATEGERGFVSQWAKEKELELSYY